MPYPQVIARVSVGRLYRLDASQQTASKHLMNTQKPQGHVPLPLKQNVLTAICHRQQLIYTAQYHVASILHSVLCSPPRKLRSKNPKVALNLWQKLRKKLR